MSRRNGRSPRTAKVSRHVKTTFRHFRQGRYGCNVCRAPVTLTDDAHALCPNCGDLGPIFAGHKAPAQAPFAT